MAVALVTGGAAIHAGPAAAGPIGSSASFDVASPNPVLEVKQRGAQERLAEVERSQGGKLKKRQRVEKIRQVEEALRARQQ